MGPNLGLPSDAGQVWRDYDISSYTARVTTTKRPEQAIVDWILLRDGLRGVAHRAAGDPLGRAADACASTTRPKCRRSWPTWSSGSPAARRRRTRSRRGWCRWTARVGGPAAQRLLHSVPVQTPGTGAWVLAKEDAAVLLGELRRRSDYREHNSPYLMVNNGQSTLISTMRGRPYVRDVIVRPEAAAGFEPAPAQIDEGFALDFSPLLSADRRMIDAVIKCEIDQIEKMIPVVVEVPTRVSPRQRTQIDVPQMTHYRFHERFRWPVDRVLVVGLGMVALPMPVNGASLVPGVPLPIGNSPARADLLVFVECKGQAAPAANAAAGHAESLARGQELPRPLLTSSRDLAPSCRTDFRIRPRKPDGLGNPSYGQSCKSLLRRLLSSCPITPSGDRPARAAPRRPEEFRTKFPARQIHYRTGWGRPIPRSLPGVP